MRWKVDHKSDRDYWLDLVLVFFVVSMMGWIWEVVLILVQSGDLTKPWRPSRPMASHLRQWRGADDLDERTSAREMVGVLPL